jgi:Domain of unknown function (DUF5916)
VRYWQATLAIGLALVWLPASSEAQQDVAEPPLKRATAVRMPDGAVHLDGRLDEDVWESAPAVTDFIQKEPVEGAVPTDSIEVRFLYTGGALYVGARMSSPSRSAIQAPLSRRDDVEQSEYLLISLDTYLNRRTAYCFGVTASGVRLDHFHPSDDQTNQDSEFDPVWEARTQITDSGWTAELWIPYSQLRFNALPEQVWGLNIKRSIPSRNEENYWALIPRTVQGWASHFGDLHGITDTQPSRRVEILPSLGGSSIVTGDRDPANPFDDGKNLDRHIGLDFKMGLGPSLTLESTVNPDFGQVEADPAEVNLSSFETFFSERRPFFLENSRLLASRVVSNFFYSRRIGATPDGPASGDFVDYPRATTILGAAKLSGRLPSGLSLGFLGAVTDDEQAQTFDLETSTIDTVRVAPQTIYGVARLEQEFGLNASTASFMLTGVHRDVAPGDPLSARLARNAFSLYSDAVLRFMGGEYELRPYAGFSGVEGEPQAIDRLQRSSRRYLQRPDADYLNYDPTRSDLIGFKGGAQFERVSGRHWLGQAALDIESPELEINDLGRLTAGDAYVASTSLTYRETHPSERLRAYSMSVSTRHEWNYGGELQTGGPQGDVLGADLSLTWPNFWRTTASLNFNPRGQDERLTRGGPTMGTPQDWNVIGEVGNSTQARNTWSGRFQYGQNEDGGRLYDASGSFSLRPAPRWEFSIEPSYVRERQTQQYVTTIPRSGPQTYGQRYIFSFIDRTTIVTQFRLNYTFKPDLTLEVYAEPFAASGNYYNHGELRAPRTKDVLLYGTDGTQVEELPNGSLRVQDGTDTFTIGNDDFNVLSFRSNVVLRWEWRPGSTLFVVWQQERFSDETSAASVGAGDLFRSFAATGDNFFVVKASFWIPVD